MTLITDEQTAALVRRLLCQYIERCEELRLNQSTAATLLGLSTTRLSQIRKGIREDAPAAVSTGVFLRAKQFLASVDEARDAGVLPASSKRGEAQAAVLAYYQAQ